MSKLSKRKSNINRKRHRNVYFLNDLLYSGNVITAIMKNYSKKEISKLHELVDDSDYEKEKLLYAERVNNHVR